MPIQRSEALQPLSRQHHNGLLFCLLLGKGIRKQADVMVMQDFIMDFWYKDLQHHFELEEQYLYPLQQGYADLQTALEKMMADHYQLKSIIHQVSLTPSFPLVAELSTVLNDHIRFEERELFPLLEATISATDQAKVGHVLQHEPDANCMHYTVRFWE